MNDFTQTAPTLIDLNTRFVIVSSLSRLLFDQDFHGSIIKTLYGFKMASQDQAVKQSDGCESAFRYQVISFHIIKSDD